LQGAGLVLYRLYNTIWYGTNDVSERAGQSKILTRKRAQRARGHFIFLTPMARTHASRLTPSKKTDKKSFFRDFL